MLKRFFCGVVCAASLVLSTLSHALEVKTPGVLRVAVYSAFPPFSDRESGGIDVDLAGALAEKLGLKLDLAWAEADENVEDDLRNYVWKGHYLGYAPADVMLHMPVDPVFAERVKQVRLVAPYYSESIQVLRDLKRIPKLDNLEPFFQNNHIGVEIASAANTYLLTVYNGRLSDRVRHYRNHGEAVAALRAGEVSAVMGPRTELEGLLGPEREGFAIGAIEMTGPVVSFWQPGVAVKADRPQLAEALQKLIDEMIASGEMAAIFARHHATYKAPRLP